MSSHTDFHFNSSSSKPVMLHDHRNGSVPPQELNLDQYSIEDLVDLKISRFIQQLGDFYPENLHDLIISKVERPLLVHVLRNVGGNQVRASKILGINRNTLRKKMRMYGIL